LPRDTCRIEPGNEELDGLEKLAVFVDHKVGGKLPSGYEKKEVVLLKTITHGFQTTAFELRVPLQPTESPGTGGGRFALAHKQVFLGGLVTVLGEQ
jgi:hypothetical protein